MTMDGIMRTALAVCLLLLTGCSAETSQPTSSTDLTTQTPTGTPTGAPSIPTPSREVDAAVRVGVQYLEAVRADDAGAIYDLAWSGLRASETRDEFVERTVLDGVTNARVSGVARVGWDADGQRLAVVPVIVTADDVPQVGRVLLVREDQQWKFYDVTTPDAVPELTEERPKVE